MRRRRGQPMIAKSAGLEGAGASSELKRCKPLDSLDWRRRRASRSSRSIPRPTWRGSTHLGALPGLAPFTRGPRATMYAGRPWTIRQYAGFSTAEEINAFYRKALAAGQQGVSVAFDLATHRGYDSDHPRVDGRCRQGGRRDRLGRGHEDPVRRHPARQDVGVDDHERRGDPGARQLHRRGRGAGRAAGEARRAPSRTTSSRSSWSATPTSIRPSPRCGSSPTSSPTPPREMPKFNSISISGYHMQEAGRERWCRSWPSRWPTGAEYVRAAHRHGAWTSTPSPGGCRFFFAIGMNFFMEVAKLRAARLLWHRIMAEFGAKKPASLMLRTHCQTSGVSLAGAGPVQQRRPHRLRGDGGGAGRHAVAAHQLASTRRSRCRPSSRRGSRATPS